jgi:hypothetical protein
MIKKPQVIVELEQYTTRSMVNNTVKINCNNLDTYRKLIRFMKENNIIHHTYQPKEERAYRVVIKYVHYSTDIKEIKEELST